MDNERLFAHLSGPGGKATELCEDDIAKLVGSLFLCLHSAAFLAHCESFGRSTR